MQSSTASKEQKWIGHFSFTNSLHFWTSHLLKTGVSDLSLGIAHRLLSISIPARYR